jgi:hypothetical protein
MRSATNFQKGVSILGVDGVNTAGGCWIVHCREEIKVTGLVKLFVMNVGEAVSTFLQCAAGNSTVYWQGNCSGVLIRVCQRQLRKPSR